MPIDAVRYAQTVEIWTLERAGAHDPWSRRCLAAAPTLAEAVTAARDALIADLAALEQLTERQVVALREEEER